MGAGSSMMFRTSKGIWSKHRHQRRLVTATNALLVVTLQLRR